MVVIVRCTPGPSLRKKIGDDKHLEKYNLRVIREKKRGRPHGWTKIKSTNSVPGAINVEWNGAERALTCRVVTRGSKPAEILGDLTRYLLSRHSRRIQTLVVFPK